MAESGSGQEKTEEPTGRKIQQTRGEGQVARSKELDTLVMLLVAGFGFLFLGGDIVDGLMTLLKSSFSIDRSTIFDTNALPLMFMDKVTLGLEFVLPFYLLMVIAALCSSLPMSGWVFSTKALKPKFSRMDPIKGLKTKIFSWKGLVELSKSLLKFVIVSFVGYLLFQVKIDEFLSLSKGTLASSLSYMGNELTWVFIILSSSLVLIALFDIPFQLWQHKQQLKMTLQEVKDETKETDGSPQLKQKIRNTQREMAQQRMMEEVPKADVVVTNPTHFAVALKYDQLNMGAPIVVAMGADIIALQIRRVADANDVPILESPPLARSLYYSSDIGKEISAGLYLAVAQILAYVYQIKHYRAYGGIYPEMPQDLNIPEDLRRD